ncbi:hypothetical protein TrRE_jg1938, partial [Triparma retinervis]
THSRASPTHGKRVASSRAHAGKQGGLDGSEGGADSAMDVTAVGSRVPYYAFVRSTGRWRGRGTDDMVRAFNALKAVVNLELLGDGGFTEPDNGDMSRMVEEAVNGGDMSRWSRDEVMCCLSDVVHCMRRKLVGGEEGFVGIPSKILGGIKKMLKTTGRGLSGRGLSSYDLEKDVWDFIIQRKKQL